MRELMDAVSVWVSIYFIVFYMLMQMLILNVLSAVIFDVSNAIVENDKKASLQETKVNVTRLLD